MIADIIGNGIKRLAEEVQRERRARKSLKTLEKGDIHYSRGSFTVQPKEDEDGCLEVRFSSSSFWRGEEESNHFSNEEINKLCNMLRGTTPLDVTLPGSFDGENTDMLFYGIMALPNVRSLTIPSADNICSAITDVNLFPANCAVKKLKADDGNSFYVSTGMIEESTHTLIEVVKKCPQLTSLLFNLVIPPDDHTLEFYSAVSKLSELEEFRPPASRFYGKGFPLTPVKKIKKEGLGAVLTKCTRLRSLDLTSFEVDDKQGQALGRVLALLPPSLEELCLDNLLTYPHFDCICDGIRQSKAFSTIKTLHFGSNAHWFEGARAPAESHCRRLILGLTALETLSLNNCDPLENKTYSDSEAEDDDEDENEGEDDKDEEERKGAKIRRKTTEILLSVFFGHPTLKKLDLCDNNFSSPRRVKALAEAIRSLPCLEELLLNSTLLNDNGLKPLAEAVGAAPALRSVTMLKHCKFGREGMLHWAQSIRSSRTLQLVAIEQVCSSKGAISFYEAVLESFSMQTAAISEFSVKMINPNQLEGGTQRTRENRVKAYIKDLGVYMKVVSKAARFRVCVNNFLLGDLSQNAGCPAHRSFFHSKMFEPHLLSVISEYVVPPIPSAPVLKIRPGPLI